MISTMRLKTNEMNNILEIPSSLLLKTGITSGEKTILRFGSKSCPVTVLPSRRSEGTLSKNCVDELHFPAQMQINLKVGDDELVIGPYVGILASLKEKNLPARLKSWLNILQYTSHNDGIILVFSAEGINREQLCINGHIYDSEEKKWKSGVFPYPDSIYKRMGLNRNLLNHLKDQTGNKIFNETSLSKWKVYQYLSMEESLKPYLPSTNIYKSPQDVIELTDTFQSVFLKPTLGSYGKNTYQISPKDPSLYIIKHREKGENHEDILHASELKEYLTHHLGRKKYIVQQGLNITFRDDKVIDYRLYLSKDASGEWRCTGWIAKAGVPNSIVSNHSNGGSVENAEKMLQECLGGDAERAEAAKQRAYSIACKAAACLEKNSGRQFGYFGVDLAIDAHGQLWIIEMNHRYVDDKLPLSIGDRALYEKIQTSYLSCLRFLSGF
ncbi:YheC/YheD family protein [Halobacillus halophilus]|uniref:YheC/YheD family endospore coat-associated protein n=1 Tax=Halobacillus halophilus TaxID=1570 RepID=UPI001CD4E84B|nr:YheC/YheD family protein [Halobacillus halophilus]MCA1011489.1 YheC/YheD family protein [Halobacillus halophilus]